MLKSEVKIDRITHRNEKCLAICCCMILVIGIVIDTCGITLYEMDQEYLDGICNTIVGIQATVFGIVFSMLTLISGFQDKEKYGMPVVKYLTKFRYRFFNQNNVLLIELCLLVISASLLFFGFNNTLFCCFLISLSLIWFLTSEILVLYRIEDIYEEMFNFLKANLHNEQLDLLQKYIDEEKKRFLPSHIRAGCRTAGLENFGYLK